MAEKTDIVIFSLNQIRKHYPLVAQQLEEIFQLEDVHETIHGDAAEIKEMVQHCLRLKGSALDGFESQLERFMENYSKYVNVLNSMSCEHMVECVEDDLGIGEGTDEIDDFYSDEE